MSKEARKLEWLHFLSKTLKSFHSSEPCDYPLLLLYQKVDDFIEEKGLRDNYKYIGIVSEKELWSLMHYSLAVINPSEFEGWNTSVMQAKALSKYNIV